MSVHYGLARPIVDLGRHGIDVITFGGCPASVFKSCYNVLNRGL
jgi:hypothetical protein